MEIGKQRQVCQGFRLNQGSNPHDLLLDDPWDLTHGSSVPPLLTQAKRAPPIGLPASRAFQAELLQ